MRWFVMCFSALVVCGLVASSADAAVIIQLNNVSAQADDGDLVSDTFTGTSTTSSELLEAVNDTSVASVDIDYSVMGSATILDHQFTLERGGNQDDFSRTEMKYLTFYIADDTPYSLMGNISLTDNDQQDPGTVYLESTLFDLTYNSIDPNGYVFNNLQISHNTVDESLVLGNQLGDASDPGNNFLFGNLTGTLLGGRSYQWYYSGYTKAQQDPDSGATATGRFKLVLGNQIIDAPVPEPTSLLTLSGLALCFGLGSWRMRRRQAA